MRSATVRGVFAWLRRLVLYRLLGGRLMLALTVLGLIRRLISGDRTGEDDARRDARLRARRTSASVKQRRSAVGTRSSTEPVPRS